MIYTTIENVADFFLSKQPMSAKKLNKLCYFAYVWHLSLSNEMCNDLSNRLFEDKFEAWVHGCTNTKLFYKYQEYGSKDIPKLNHFKYNFDSEVLEILEETWEEYGKFSGLELESIQTQQTPWLDARIGYGICDVCNIEIDDRIIWVYYNREIVISSI